MPRKNSCRFAVAGPGHTSCASRCSPGCSAKMPFLQLRAWRRRVSCSTGAGANPPSRTQVRTTRTSASLSGRSASAASILGKQHDPETGKLIGGRSWGPIWGPLRTINQLIIIIQCLIRSRWRREWDSNPRYGFPHTRFPSVRLKPLGHLSRHLLMTGRAGFCKRAVTVASGFSLTV